MPQKETQQPAPLKEAQQPAPQKEAQQPAPQKLADPVAEKQAAVVPSSHAEVLKSPGPRGAKRPHVTPEKPKKPSKEPSETDDAEHDEDDEPPKVLNFGTLSKLEKEKVRRICTPKRGSGNLEVPENIFDMWRDCSKGRDNLLRMWAKSGGVKAGMGPNFGSVRYIIVSTHYLALSRLSPGCLHGIPHDPVSLHQKQETRSERRLLQ